MGQSINQETLIAFKLDFFSYVVSIDLRQGSMRTQEYIFIRTAPTRAQGNDFFEFEGGGVEKSSGKTFVSK